MNDRKPLAAHVVVRIRRAGIDTHAVRVHHRDAGPFLRYHNKGDLLPIRRPGRIFVVGIIARELHDVLAVGIHGKKLFLARNDRNEDKLFAIR